MAANCVRKKLEYHRNCTINPKCCLKPNELECPTNFNPPVLGTSVDFCKEALAKAIPIPECILAKPQKLMIATEPVPEDVLPTHRHLKNWQKWCRIWKRNQEKLSDARKDPNPPLMTCGEGWSYRKEDTELFDRTLHPNYLTGFAINNAMHPDGLRPGETDPFIREVVLPRYSRNYPEMKRYRYAKRIRDEMGLPVRCPSEEFIPTVTGFQLTPNDEQTSVSMQTSGITAGRCFNWEDRWRHYVANSRWMMTSDLLKYGYPKPAPEDLILQQPGISGSGPQHLLDSDTTRRINVIPEFTFNLQVHDTMDEGGATTLQDQDKSYYTETRGPVLQVLGEKANIELSYKVSKTDYQSSQKVFFEDWEPFSATSKGKETRFIGMKNEGTTAIRYQWLRFPPSQEMGNMLANPARYLALGGECQDDMNKFHVKNTLQKQSSNKTVPKASALEFRFRELPGVLLPGQSAEFPIVFRCQTKGYYYETLYLLTHPKLSDELGQSYAVRLTGNCMDPDLSDNQEDQNQNANKGEFRPENVEEALKQITLEQEATDMINSVLDHALFHESSSPCSLPFGKVTAEGIFYTHNKHLNYHYGASEKSLETVRSLIEMLVPQERLNHNESLCNLSIQSLYNLLRNRNSPRDYYWTHFKSPQAENLLKNLAEQNNILNQPRIFAYPNVQIRQKTACYTTLLSVFDEILTQMDNIDELYSSPELNKIFEGNAQVNVESGRLSSLNENYINLMDLEAEYAQAYNEEGELSNEEETIVPPTADEATEEDPGGDGDYERSGVSDEEPKRKSNQSAASEVRRKKKSNPEAETKGKSKQKGKVSSSKSPNNDDDKDTKPEPGNPRKEKKKKLKNHDSQGKTEKVEILTASSPEEEEAQPAVDDEGEDSNTSARTEPSEDEPEVGTPPPPGTPPGTKHLPSSDQEMKDEINGEKKLRADQFKRIMFESLFSSGIERMLSVVDATKSMEDYRTSPYVTNPDDNADSGQPN